MLYKLVPESTLAATAFMKSIDGITSPGSPNEMPQPFQEISRDTFVGKTQSYNPEYIEHRSSVRDIQAGAYLGVTIYWYRNGAYIWMHPTSWACAKDMPFHGDRNIRHSGERYSYAGCLHRNSKEKLLGRCWHQYTCNACGYTWEVDSSD